MKRPMLTQREAADACGVSRTTIRRAREAGDLPGSVQDPKRGWMIPIDGLLAAGYRLNAPAPADSPAPGGSAAPAAAGEQDAVVLRAELERLRAEHELALARAELQHLRAQLAERGERIADLQRAVAALTPAPSRAELALPERVAMPGQAMGGTAAEQATAWGDGPEARKRWWGGRP
ncbi:helix-turn-helix domain-containing protein [Streptomyces sp. H27-S2]|uniref:helix-turn-helix domain-containing protein n=1 Tax=Streptomyces antarcticus TaxID=2996458 RepID=UPI00226E41C1|nr:helix-turn-helix domain-containing protein [Streptomyces sp. H27-S2]MCY0954135.1 helix-turn-helix domain-containing protein [Streptomyces sp. H27-S2]